jgi:hypothetical protein
MGIGFGSAAERYASRLPPGLSMIAADLGGAVRALEAAVKRRRAGDLFYAAPLIDDPRSLIAQQLSGPWMERLTTIDKRYQAFDALAGDRLSSAGVEVSAADLLVIDEPSRRVLRDFTITGDALLVRSSRDAERVLRILGRRRPVVLAAPGEDPEVPGLGSARGDAVVVWAPLLHAGKLGVIAMALEYMKCRVIYVCASGRLENVRGDFVGPAQGAAALAEAACVIDAAISDPASTIALRRRGIPVVAASTTGASEFLDGILEYEPWDWRTIFAAAAVARGARPPVLKRETVPFGELALTLERAAAPPNLSEPLVSVVVLTYNRRELLALALRSIARQRYENIEVIIVNNGGDEISETVAPYPSARLITLAENILPNAAVELGFDACRGKYFCVLSDDDEYFPDHIARLVHALERADAEVGHSNAVTRYVSLETGTRKAVAFRVRHDRPSDHLQMLVGGTMVIHSMLFRHDVRQIIGGFQIDLAPADFEYQIRAAQRFDFVHVDVVTCEWNYAVEGSSYTHRDNMYAGLKTIYEQYSSGPSTIVETRRRAELERFDARKAGPLLWPPDLPLPGSTFSQPSLNSNPKATPT